MVTWENTFDEVARARPRVAILPIGSIEQHSHHLPLATDYLIAQALGRLIAERLDDCYLLPALPFSCSHEHGDFAGTVWLRPATLAAVIEDLVGSLGQHGITRVALVVAHGGNWIIKPTVRELNLARTGVRVIFTTPGLSGAEQGALAELHAGADETSLLLHLRPELVKLGARRPDFAPRQGREFLDYVGMAALSPAGLWGAPGRASAAEGARLLEQAASRAAEYIRDTLEEMDRLLEAGPEVAG